MTAFAEIEKGIILSLMNYKGYGEMFPRVVSSMKHLRILLDMCLKNRIFSISDACVIAEW